jgi:type VI secretion system protein ImpB
LRKLLEIRRELKGLLAKTDGNDRLNEQLQEIISNTELLQRLRQEAGLGDLGDEGEKTAEEGANG